MTQLLFIGMRSLDQFTRGQPTSSSLCMMMCVMHKMFHCQGLCCQCCLTATQSKWMRCQQGQTYSEEEPDNLSSLQKSVALLNDDFYRKVWYFYLDLEECDRKRMCSEEEIRRPNGFSNDYATHSIIDKAVYKRFRNAVVILHFQLETAQDAYHVARSATSAGDAIPVITTGICM